MNTNTSNGVGSPGCARSSAATPVLAISYEGRPNTLLEAVVGRVGALEITPDCLTLAGHAAPNPVLLEHVDELLPTSPVTYHGIGLSMGTATGWNDDYLRLLDAMCAWRMPLLHSEHLGYTTVDGSFLGAMPALPTTLEAANLVIERATRLRRHLGIECLLEHVASPLPRTTEMRLASWLNLVCRESGCGMLLDLYNLECDADNGFIDLAQFLDEIDTTLVGEIHLAAGVWHEGLHLDVHSHLTERSTLDLLTAVLPRCPNLRIVTYEILSAAVPIVGVEKIAGHIGELGALLSEVHYATL